MPEVSTANTMLLNNNSNNMTNSNNCHGSVCLGCRLVIKDKFIYQVKPDYNWHEHCLKCAECECRLNENSTCFIKNGKAYCKSDFIKLSSIKCDRCGVNLQRNDLIMKCKSRIYHMDCFSCSVCHKKLLPGDEFQLKNELLYCKKDAILTSTYNHTQLYLTGLNPPSNTFVNSSVSMTPENSINSSASMSSSTSTFSPSNNSTSSCSSVVDSPTNSSGFNTLSSTNSSILLSHSSFNFNSTTNSYFHLDSNNNNTSHKSGNDMVANKTANSYFEYDYQDKEDDGCISGGDEDDENDEDSSDLDESSDEEDSLNESATSVGGAIQKSKKDQTKHRSAVYSDGSSLIQINGKSHHHHHRSGNNKPARIRTVLNEKQLNTLRACYNANPRPDALMKEQLVEMTGLNPRVIRVWFQNKRCKDKKKNVLTRQDPLPMPNHQFHQNGGVMSMDGSHLRLPISQNGIMYDNCYS